MTVAQCGGSTSGRRLHRSFLQSRLSRGWFVRPSRHAIHHPVCWLGLLVAIVSTIMLVSGLSTHREVRAFLGSNGLLVGLLATGAGAIFPVMLYSTLAPENSLTAYAVAANPRALHIASIGGRWFRAGDHLFRVHLPTLRGKSQPQAGHPRVLLEVPSRILSQAFNSIPRSSCS